MTGKLPPNASVATSAEGDKLFAPAAARNVDAILQVIADHAPAQGRALEIASGTGQHIAAIAAACPALQWQPTEVDAARRRSIDAYVQEAGLSNVAPAQHLDATSPGWGKRKDPVDFLCLSNLLHLISDVATRTLLQEAAAALSADGVFMIYGPFKRYGDYASDGDRRFDADLRGSDPAIGYKDLSEIDLWSAKAGLNWQEKVSMPANNLALILRKGSA